VRHRVFGRTGWSVSEVGLGTWQLGGADWGDVDDESALQTLHAAADAGVNFFDTADVYGLGRSERLVGRFLEEREGRFYVATKLGRFPEPGWPENFSLRTFRAHAEASLERLGVAALDLLQLHCIPTDLLRDGEVFGWLDTLKAEGTILEYGVSVETVEEAEICLRHEGVAALQIIFNIFRQKPTEIFAEAREKGVGLIVRLPLASGLLAGKLSKSSQFADNDHRKYNRDGQAFNVGETFAGLPFEAGVELADAIKPHVPDGMSMAQMALRWILDFPEVGVVIPGARNTAQVHGNVAASDLPPLPDELHQRLADLYATRVREHIRGPY
jgi:aryl-alcohol dehydrogenase-like predicted oxidoreductase